MSTISKFKWFWAWDDEKEEAYLRDMALSGWHFVSVLFPGKYNFKQGEPRNDVFRLDFLSNTKDKDDYLQLFEDAGWDHVGEYGSWQYFRKTTPDGESPEIFTDNESKEKKYSRIMLFLIIFLPIYTTLMTRVNEASSVFYKIVAFVMFLLLLLYSYAIVRLIHRIGQLRKKM